MPIRLKLVISGSAGHFCVQYSLGSVLSEAETKSAIDKYINTIHLEYKNWCNLKCLSWNFEFCIVSYVHRGCIYLIRNTVKTVILWNIISAVFFKNKSKTKFISYFFKAEFSASLLQSSVSHDHSDIILIWWFPAQETFLIIINTKNSLVA